ncbi:serine/threonine-protein kinase [Streptomyces sp. NPDC002057]|uniref:serine/threonine-protein kinase n=1 Tax=Streptomyces sp. NPDC002057 TaxID=3154664 RepID=UPI00331E89C8
MDMLSPEDPPRIGPYWLIGRLGAGGMGRVYLGRSEGGRTVAIKVVHDGFAHSPEFRRRFAQEVESARRVGGNWTAPVLDADTAGPTPWVATGYILGPDLHTVVSREYGPLPVASVLALANGLARALSDIHGAGLVHRDVKPSNILLTPDGPRVIDFGIARALETPVDGFLTRTGAVIGSPGFMSPEQVRGERRLTPASDVFCLGVVLHYASTGRTPFGALDSGAHALMFRTAEEEADLTGLPSGLLELVRDCLHKDPRHRPTTDEIAAQSALYSTDVRPPWLPAELLTRLGSQADRLLNQDIPAAAATPVPQGQAGTEAHEGAEPDREPETGPRLEPSDGRTPEDRRRHLPKRKGWQRRLALAAGLLVLAGAGVTLTPLLDKEGKAGDGDKNPGQTAPVTPSALNSSDFVGSWSGEVTDNTRKDGIRFVSFTIQEGAPSTGHSADFILQYPERVCLGTVHDMGVTGHRAVVMHKNLYPTDEGGPSCSPDTQTLTLTDGVLKWRAGNSTALLRKDVSADPDEGIQRAYVGKWSTSDTTPSMRLEIVSLKTGAEIVFSAGEMPRDCYVSAIVTVATRDRVFGAVPQVTPPDMGICHGHSTFDIRPAGKDRLRILTKRGVPYIFTRTGA